MTINQMIKKIEELKELLVTEIGLELSDYARERAYYSLDGAIDYLQENYE